MGESLLGTLNLNNITNLTFNISLVNISFYNYKHNISTDIFFTNNRDGKTFTRFIRHPLIYWNLDILVNNQKHFFDLITNTSSSVNFNADTIHNINFVNDPCMIFKKSEFLDNFYDNNLNNNFSNTNKYINEYKDILLKKLIFNEYNNGIFLQEFYSGINGHKYSIIKYKKLF